MVEPLPVYIKIDGEEKQIIGWACPECKMYHSPLVYVGRNDEEARKAAIRCCHRLCEDCGKDVGKSSWIACNDCRLKRDGERSRKAYEKAKKVPYADYDGEYLYCDEDFFGDLGALEDHFADEIYHGNVTIEDEPVIYACTPRPLHLNADDIVSSELEDHYEDAGDQISDKAYARLQRMLDKWCRDVGITSYESDSSRVIIMPEGWWADLFKEAQGEAEAG